MKEDENNLEIVEGDGSGINMSPVSNYLVSMKPKKSENKKVVIPKEKKLKKRKD